jgi:hypothetical protein
MVAPLVYEKPMGYLLIHIGLGLLAAFYFPIVWFYLAYQALQLILQKRFFLFEWQIKDGNSITHTGVKIIEFFIGFFIGIILLNSRR